MPPRKSDVSKVATGDEGTPAKENPAREGINVEDLNLPKSIVTRLAKGVLPPNTQIQGNAMLAMTKSATVFVNYLAAHANENAQGQGRKTIAPQDVFRALEDLEFPDFRPRLEAELGKFNEVQTDKRNTYRKKVAADKASGKPEDEDGDTTLEHEGEGDADGLGRDGQPAAKKARRDASQGGAGEDEGDLREGDGMGDREDEEVDEEGDADETEDEEGEHDAEERLEADDHLEEEQEAEDEALDNGEDSD